MLLKNKLKDLQIKLKVDNVFSKLEERYCYAKDALNLEDNFRIPDLVVFVNTIEEIIKIVKYANTHSIPIIPRGAGTNMVGSCVCTQGGIVLNFSKMNKILNINPTNMTVTVQPGVILKDLKDAVGKFGLFFPPDPSNYKVSTVGGAIAQSSSGAMAFKYGTTKNYVLSLKVISAEGKLLDLGCNLPKNPLGYHLMDLIPGSEGTLAIIVEATFKLIPQPEFKKTLIAYFDSVENINKTITSIISQNIFPASIDFMDNNSMVTVENFLSVGLKTQYKYLLLIEVDGNYNSVQSQIEKITEILKNSNSKEIIIPNTSKDADKIWQARHSSYAAATRLAPDVISDDIIVPREKISDVIFEIENLSKIYNLKICLVGHIGDGNFHPQFVLDLNSENDFRNFQEIRTKIYSKVKKLGGSVSAEHGIGLEKKEFFQAETDITVIEYMKAIKKIFDPKNILNPGKIFN